MNAAHYNEWLDEYNDFIRLYETFGDAEYKRRAEEALERLGMLVIGIQRQHRLVELVHSDRIHAWLS